MDLSELTRKLYKLAARLNLYIVLCMKNKTDNSRIISEITVIETLLCEIRNLVDVTTDK